MLTFGLTDRYTWLEEDYPRADGVPRRPLPFDESLRPKPCAQILADALGQARQRQPAGTPSATSGAEIASEPCTEALEQAETDFLAKVTAR